MTINDVLTNYSLTSDRALEGHFNPLPGLFIAGTAEQLTNVDSAALPVGRVITYKGSVAGGVGIANATSQVIAGFSFYDAAYERATQFNNGLASAPSAYPTSLIRSGATLFVIPETNLSKADTLFYRCIMNANPGVNDGLGRIRNTGDFIAISNRALTSNVVTLTTAAPHGLTVGQVITTSGIPTDTVLNGTFTVDSVPSSTTFTFALTNANITSTSSTGSIARAVAFPANSVRLLEPATAGSLARINIDLPL